MARSTDAQVVPAPAGTAVGPAIADPPVASIGAGARESDRYLDENECRGGASKTLSELELRRASAEGEQEGDATISSKVDEAEERVLVSSRLVVDATAATDEAIVFGSSLGDVVDAFDAKLVGEQRTMRGGPRSVKDVVDQGKSAGESRLWSVCTGWRGMGVQTPAEGFLVN